MPGDEEDEGFMGAGLFDEAEPVGPRDEEAEEAMEEPLTPQEELELQEMEEWNRRQLARQHGYAVADRDVDGSRDHARGRLTRIANVDQLQVRHLRNPLSECGLGQP